MSNQIIFTKEELKKFLKTSPLTLNNLLKLIEDKTNQKLAIVQKAMVYDINQQLLSNILYISKIGDFIYSNWAELIKVNKDTNDKWKEELKPFRDK